MRLLLVEDDIRLAPNLRKEIKRAGYAVDWVENGIDAQHKGETEPYDAIILDLGLPGRSGMDVLRNWRKAQITIPVIILTARDNWNERVDGLKAGADDYMGKPFHTEELVARLDALIRRTQNRVDSTLELAGISIDDDRQEVTNSEGEIHTLTSTEYRLLRYLMTHPDSLLSKSRLTDHVYEGDSDRDSNVIEVYINRLRHKLGKGYIETRRGQGYCFVSKPK